MQKRKKEHTIEYNPAFKSRGCDHVRWIENVSRGLRLVGFADEINHNIEHTGWYTDDEGVFETFRGIVYQLPARDRRELFAYGYADPNNPDCALLCFDLDAETKEEAARYADQFAERAAEEECDYNRAWQAGREYDDLADKIVDTRKEALAIAEEMRQAKSANLRAPTICATLRAKVFSLYREIQKMRKRRRELFDDFGRCDGFAG